MDINDRREKKRGNNRRYCSRFYWHLKKKKKKNFAHVIIGNKDLDFKKTSACDTVFRFFPSFFSDFMSCNRASVCILCIRNSRGVRRMMVDVGHGCFEMLNVLKVGDREWRGRDYHSRSVRTMMIHHE